MVNLKGVTIKNTDDSGNAAHTLIHKDEKGNLYIIQKRFVTKDQLDNEKILRKCGDYYLIEKYVGLKKKTFNIMLHTLIHYPQYFMFN